MSIKEYNATFHIMNWMSKHRQMVPLGDEDPAVDLLIKFVQTLKLKKIRYGAAIIAATCIHLLHCLDSKIFATPKDVAKYFKINEASVKSLSSELMESFLTFIDNKVNIFCSYNYTNIG